MFDCLVEEIYIEVVVLLVDGYVVYFEFVVRCVKVLGVFIVVDIEWLVGEVIDCVMVFVDYFVLLMVFGCVVIGLDDLVDILDWFFWNDLIVVVLIDGDCGLYLC